MSELPALRPNLLNVSEAMLVVGMPLGAARGIVGEQVARAAARTYHVLIQHASLDDIIKGLDGGRFSAAASEQVAAAAETLDPREAMTLPVVLFQLSTAVFALREIASEDVICEAVELWATTAEPWQAMRALDKEPGRA